MGVPHPPVWIKLSTGNITIQWISINKTNYAIRWIVIYSVDSVIHLLNNRALVVQMMDNRRYKMDKLLSSGYIQWISVNKAKLRLSTG